MFNNTHFGSVGSRLYFDLVAPKRAVWWVELCDGFEQVVKRITRVAFPPVVLVEVAWKFALHCPVHRLQLSLDLTPHTFYRVRVGTCVRVNKVLGVVNHEVYVADTVQVEVWRKLVRDYCCSRLDELLH